MLICKNSKPEFSSALGSGQDSSDSNNVRMREVVSSAEGMLSTSALLGTA